MNKNETSITVLISTKAMLKAAKPAGMSWNRMFETMSIEIGKFQDMKKKMTDEIRKNGAI